MKWKKFSIKTTTLAEDIVVATLDEIGIQGAEIEDKQPLTEDEKAQMFVDIMPEGPADDGIAYVNYYLEEDEDAEAILENVKTALEELRSFMDIGEGTITASETEDKDWINNWKQYFSQFYVDDILIIPSWEDVKVEDQDRMVLHIDPGTAFGTGKHETTQLCIRQLKKYVTPDTELLDVGTGSGILGIIALKLGTKHVVGTDLDPCAVPAVAENLENNGLGTGASTDITDASELVNPKFDLIIGNVIDNEEVQAQVGFEKYDIVVANILAEVLVPLTPVVVNHLKPGGVYITSGIIDVKEELIVETVQKAGLELVEVTRQGEWVSVTARKKED
jgi:ribosomal protein L11 methyltransferase